MSEKAAILLMVVLFAVLTLSAVVYTVMTLPAAPAPRCACTKDTGGCTCKVGDTRGCRCGPGCKCKAKGE